MNCKESVKIFALLLFAAAVLLCACAAPGEGEETAAGCTHQWTEASCQAPRSCSLCGLTEGSVLPHNWTDASCTSPSPCTMCGTLDGLELVHSWRADAPICDACGLDERPADVRFVEKLGLALNNRWAILGDTLWYVVESPDTWNAIVSAEYRELGGFKEETFEDEALQQLALGYIGTLEETRDALQYVGTEQWTKLYVNNIRHRQNLLLYQINTISPISVAEVHREKLQELLDKGEELHLLNLLMDSVRYHNLDNYDGVYTYEAVFENVTDTYFRSVTFKVEFTDADGNVITTKTFTLSGWDPGEKVYIRFNTRGAFVDGRVANVKWDK